MKYILIMLLILLKEFWIFSVEICRYVMYEPIRYKWCNKKKNKQTNKQLQQTSAITRI